MEGGDSEFVNFTLPTLKTFLEKWMCLATSNNLLLVLLCYRVPPIAFFPGTRDLVSQKMMQRHFVPTLHPLSLVIFATATVVAFVLHHNYRFNFHYYTQREATPTQKSAWKWHCGLSRLLVQKITKGLHSCKPASLNRPIECCVLWAWELSSLPRSSWHNTTVRFLHSYFIGI